MTSQPIRMKVHLIWRIVYILELIAVGYYAAVFLLAGSIALGMVFVLFMAGVIYAMLLSYSRIEVDAERILFVRPPYGRYALRWDEITEAQTTGRIVLLRGDQKAVGFNTLMGDGHGKHVKTWIEDQLRVRNIDFQQVKKLPKVSGRELKNTRLPR